MKRILPNRPLTERERNQRYYRRHRKTELERNRVYAQLNAKHIAARHRLNRRGMTQAEHDAKMKAQRSRCAICFEKFRKTPHLDHCHASGKNRGILCGDCNLGLGRFKDSIKRLRSAIKYLGVHNVRR